MSTSTPARASGPTGAVPAEVVIDAELERRIARLVLDSAMLIDRDELESWLECFCADASYIVMPRENRELGHPVALIHCGNKAILNDRIAVLRHASKFNPHYDRHILGGTRVLSCSDSEATAETNFMVIQTTRTGVSTLFCAGVYEDRLRLTAGRPQLLARVALLDSFSVPTLLATPV